METWLGAKVTEVRGQTLGTGAESTVRANGKRKVKPGSGKGKSSRRRGKNAEAKAGPVKKAGHDPK